MRIPDYQRGYSWEEDQLKDFWKDLMNLKSGQSHYMGVLTIEKVSEGQYKRWDDDLWAIEEKSFDPFYVVDGHQRVLTSIVLMEAIVERLRKEEILNYDKKEEIIKKYLYLSRSPDSLSRTFLFGYEKDDPSFEFFKTKILGQVSNSDVEINTIYTANLMKAKDFFKKNIDVLDKKAMEEVYKKLTQSLKFNVYEIEDEIDVFIAFETMNNRGKKLSNLELMKNRLIYLSTTMESDEIEARRLRSNINETWKQIYRYLGKNKNNPLDDDDFLEDHWKMYFSYSRKAAEQYKIFLLGDYFTMENMLNKNINGQVIQNYIDSLQESIAVWYQIKNPLDSGYSEVVKEWLLRLQRLGSASFTPLIMAGLIREGLDGTSGIAELLERIEKFIFLIIKVSKKNYGFGDSAFYEKARDLYFSKRDLNFIILELDLWTIGGTSQDGEEYDGWFNKDMFKTVLKDKFKHEQGGFFGWSGIRYFLFEYENHLRRKSRYDVAKINWDEFKNEKKGEITIEHVYPQSSNEECWISKFEKFKEDQRYSLCNSLGNLLALSRGKNSSLQDFCYKKKRKDDNGDFGYFNGSFSEIEISENYLDWGENEILERGLKLLQFMEERWGISLGDNKEKIEILNLQFLMDDQ